MQRVWSTYLDSFSTGHDHKQSDGSHRVRNAVVPDRFCSTYEISCLPLLSSFSSPSFRWILRRRSSHIFLSQYSLPSSDSSRPPSVASHANSAYSFAGSTRHILSDMDGPLDPPSAPFVANAANRGSASSIRSSNSEVSLSINYLPTKFSSSLLGRGTARKRKGKKGDALNPVVPKRGGGVEAFRSGEARMPGEGDEDYDGVTGGWLGGKVAGSKPKKLRWNRFKWILFLANILVRISYTCHHPI
jgi:hypothetical protein